MIRFNETEIRNSAKETLESLEHWSRRIINDKFVDKCMTCRRYLDGRCSILRHAIEGRIQSSISNSICSEFKEKKVNKRSKNK